MSGLPTVNFTHDRVAELKDVFQLSDPSGTGCISIEDLRLMPWTTSSTSHHVSQSTEQMIDDLIAFSDVDGDGMVDFAEFVSLMMEADTVASHLAGGGAPSVLATPSTAAVGGGGGGFSRRGSLGLADASSTSHTTATTTSVSLGHTPQQQQHYASSSSAIHSALFPVPSNSPQQHQQLQTPSPQQPLHSPLQTQQQQPVTLTQQLQAMLTAFQELDTNHTGYLSRELFSALLQQHGDALSAEECDALWHDAIHMRCVKAEASPLLPPSTSTATAGAGVGTGVVGVIGVPSTTVQFIHYKKFVWKLLSEEAAVSVGLNGGGGGGGSGGVGREGSGEER